MRAAGRAPTRRLAAADLIVLWGSNAREAHPIFFHHVLKAVNDGAQLIVVDPRRTPSAQWADLWLGLDVGTDIPLANAVGARDHRRRPRTTWSSSSARRPASRPTATRSSRGRSTRPSASPASRPTRSASSPTRTARATNAQLCWTLGITEHHNAVDNVFALINLALLTGKVGKWGSGLQPLRGQNNVQGGGDMGAIPNKLPGFQELLDDGVRAKFEAAWGSSISAQHGLHLTGMFEAMEHGELRARLRRRREPGAGRGGPAARRAAPRGPRPPRRAGPLPHAHGASSPTSSCPRRRRSARSDGTVTSSERRVQRVRKALDAAGRGARRHRDRLRARAPSRPRPRLAARGGRLERAALALADARGDELRAARGARRHPVAVRRRGRSRARSSSTAGSWDDVVEERAPFSRSSTIRPSTCSTTTSRCG